MEIKTKAQAIEYISSELISSFDILHKIFSEIHPIESFLQGAPGLYESLKLGVYFTDLEKRLAETERILKSYDKLRPEINVKYLNFFLGRLFDYLNTSSREFQFELENSTQESENTLSKMKNMYIKCVELTKDLYQKVREDNINGAIIPEIRIAGEIL